MKTSYFGGYSEHDGTVRFYSRVNALLQDHYTVLDVGCGRAAYQDDPCEYRRKLRILKGKCNRVIGLDVDPEASQNPYIDEFLQIDGAQWPIDSASVNLIVSDNTVEHIEEPALFFDECSRVLSPGGYLCIRTPNRAGYVAVVSRLLPASTHRRVLSVAQKTRQEEDVFPAYYRCNTIRSVSKQLKAHGLDYSVRGYDGDPQYFSFSKLFFKAAQCVHRITPSALRNSLFVFAQKPGHCEKVKP